MNEKKIEEIKNGDGGFVLEGKNIKNVKKEEND